MSALEPVAATVQRLAVMLSAGVPPGAAWSYLDPVDPVIVAVAEGDEVSATIVAATREPAWLATAAAWRVATDAGAPLAPTLKEFARTLRSLAAVERDIEVSLAGPAATTKLVMILPLVAILFGVVLGFDTLRILFTTGPGLTCLGLGAGLMVAAWLWSRRLMAAARPKDVSAGLRCELVAIAVSGGGSVERALRLVDSAVEAVPLADDDGSVAAVLALSTRAGVPAAELLRSEAEEQRRRSAASARRGAEVLGVRLMLPLGLCILPAFMIVGVAPLLIAVISSTVSSC